MVVKYESRRPNVFATHGFPNPGAAYLPKIDAGSTRRIVRAAPHLHRFRRARRKERGHPQHAPDRQDAASSVGGPFSRQAERRLREILPFMSRSHERTKSFVIPLPRMDASRTFARVRKRQPDENDLHEFRLPQQSTLLQAYARNEIGRQNGNLSILRRGNDRLAADTSTQSSRCRVHFRGFAIGVDSA